MLSQGTEVTEAEKLRIEINKVLAETRKINQETQEIARRTYWMPFSIMCVGVGGLTALIIFLSKFFA